MAHVLVVDDDEDIRDLLGLRVRRAGHRVTVLGDAAAALAHVGVTPVDLVLLDWTMVPVDGGQLCRAMRRLPHLATTPILVVTAHAGTDVRDQAMAAGATGCLVKPFALSELDLHVSVLLGTGAMPSTVQRLHARGERHAWRSA